MKRANRNVDAGAIQIGSPMAIGNHRNAAIQQHATSSTVGFGEPRTDSTNSPSCFQTAMSAIFGTSSKQKSNNNNQSSSQGARTATFAIKSYLREYDGDSSALLDAESLVVGSLINAGTEGKVFNATYAGAAVAVKEIHNQHYELSEVFKREFQFLKLIQHPGIIRLYGVVAMQYGEANRNRFLLVMEVAKGSLRDVIDRSAENANVLPLEKVLGYAIEIAQAMAYVHAQDLLHLDLKPENILLDEDGDIKICDLGLAALCTSTDKTTGIRQRTVSTAGINGTPSYMAPERVAEMRNRATNGQILDRPGTPIRISTMADVYSFAFVLYEMLHRKRSHPREWDAYKVIAEVKLRGYRPVIDGNVHPMLSKTIQRCWADDPRTRPTFRDIVKRLKKISQEIATSNSTSSSRFGGGSSILRRGKSSTGVVGNSGYKALSRFSQMFGRTTSGLGRTVGSDNEVVGGRSKKQQPQRRWKVREAPVPPPRNSGPDNNVPVAANIPLADISQTPDILAPSANANVKKKSVDVRASGGGIGHSPKLGKVDSHVRAVSNSSQNNLSSRASGASNVSGRYHKQSRDENGRRSKQGREHNKKHEYRKPGNSGEWKRHV